MQIIMSAEDGRVATLLLQEAFGGIVGTVGSYLIKYGPRALPDILKGTDLDKEQVGKLINPYCTARCWHACR